MGDQFPLTRRQMLGSSLLMASAVAPLSAQAQSEKQESTASSVKPLAQDYVVVDQPPPQELFCDDPALTRLPGGGLLATWTHRPKDRKLRFRNPRRFQLARSDDGGKTWQHFEPLDINMGLPFVHEGKLYLIGNKFGRKDIIISRSDDEGKSWLPPVTLLEGEFWNAPTGYAITNDQLYRAFDSGRSNDGKRPISVVAGDLGRDLMDPKAWRTSNTVPYPGTPVALRRQKYPEGVIPYTFKDHWLEPNVINVHGRLMVLVRCRIVNYATTNLAAVCDLVDDGKKLDLEFTQFYPLPGGQGKFHIVYDDPSGLFWMLSNPATDCQNSQGLGKKLWKMGFRSGLGNERRILMLYYSLDGLNWFGAGCVAMSTNPLQSFMYASPLVDGDDMLVISRTSKDAPNQHDADLCTFHRIATFRSLALNLHPEL